MPSYLLATRRATHHTQSPHASIIRGDSITLYALPFLVLVQIVLWGIHFKTFERAELGLDGALSVDLALSPLRAMAEFNLRDVHPPLFYAFLKVWFAVAGVHYLTAKYLPIAASTLSVSLLFQLVRRAISTRAALFSIILFSLSAPVLFQAPTVRDFTPGLAISLASTLSTLHALHRQQSSSWITWPTLTLLQAAGLLTWYFHLFFWAAAVLLARQKRSWSTFVALLCAVILASPWYILVIPHILNKLAHGVTTTGQSPHLPSLVSFLHGWVKGQVGIAGSFPLNTITFTVWLAALISGLFTLWHLPSSTPCSREGRILITAALGLGVVEIAFSTLRWSDPAALSRYLLPIEPFTAAVIATNLHSQSRFKAVYLLPPLLLLPVTLLWWFLLARGPGIDWEHNPALSYVAEHQTSGDVLLFGDRASQGRYWLDAGTLPTAVIHAAGAAYLSDSPIHAQRVITYLNHHYRRIWYLVPNGAPNHFGTIDLAASDYRLLDMHTSSGTLSLWQTHGPFPHNRFVGALFGDQIALTQAAYTAMARPTQPVLFTLVWRSVHRPDANYTVFVHLISSSGHILAQHDSRPQLGNIATKTLVQGAHVIDRFAITIPSTAVPGTYSIHVGLYRQNQRLTLPNHMNYFVIGTLRVL